MTPTSRITRDKQRTYKAVLQALLGRRERISAITGIPMSLYVGDIFAGSGSVNGIDCSPIIAAKLLVEAQRGAHPFEANLLVIEKERSSYIRLTKELTELDTVGLNIVGINDDNRNRINSFPVMFKARRGLIYVDSCGLIPEEIYQIMENAALKHMDLFINMSHNADLRGRANHNNACPTIQEALESLGRKYQLIRSSEGSQGWVGIYCTNTSDFEHLYDLQRIGFFEVSTECGGRVLDFIQCAQEDTISKHGSPNDPLVDLESSPVRKNGDKDTRSADDIQLEIRVRLQNKERERDLAKVYGLSLSDVRKIKKNRSLTAKLAHYTRDRVKESGGKMLPAKVRGNIPLETETISIGGKVSKKKRVPETTVIKKTRFGFAHPIPASEVRKVRKLLESHSVHKVHKMTGYGRAFVTKVFKGERVPTARKSRRRTPAAEIVKLQKMLIKANGNVCAVAKATGRSILFLHKIKDGVRTPEEVQAKNPVPMFKKPPRGRGKGPEGAVASV